MPSEQVTISSVFDFERPKVGGAAISKTAQKEAHRIAVVIGFLSVLRGQIALRLHIPGLLQATNYMSAPIASTCVWFNHSIGQNDEVPGWLMRSVRHGPAAQAWRRSDAHAERQVGDEPGDRHHRDALTHGAQVPDDGRQPPQSLKCASSEAITASGTGSGDMPPSTAIESFI